MRLQDRNRFLARVLMVLLAVLVNIFLDGKTFEHSHSVDKKPLVGDAQAGLVLQWNRFRISYTQIFRTKEFDGQDRGDLFGSLSFSYLL